MRGIWILGILLLLLAAVLWVRVGIFLKWTDTGMQTAALRLGVFRIPLFPAKKKPKAKRKKTGAESGAAPEKRKKAARPLPKPGARDILDALKALWPALRQALRRVRRGVRIAPLNLSCTLGGADEPADAARLYGEIQAAVWTGMPVLEQLLVIPQPHIHTDVDFSSGETRSAGEVGISARVGTLLGVGTALLIPALRWYLGYRKKQPSIGKDESDGNGKKEPAA